MNENELKKALQGIIEKFLNKQLTKEQVAENLVHSVDCEEVYGINNLLISDSYFALSHILEEDISDVELKYLLNCLNGQCEYSLDEKLKL
jgi:hypothetical protein